MATTTRRIHTTDTRTVIAATLKQPDEAGDLQPVDLTGKTVRFKMLNRGDDSVTIALTATGVTISDAAAGEVEYDFAAAGVLAAGKYRGFFVVDDAGETDHFPPEVNGLEINIDSDTESAEEAFDKLVFL